MEISGLGPTPCACHTTTATDLKGQRHTSHTASARTGARAGARVTAIEKAEESDREKDGVGEGGMGGNG